MFEQQPDNEKAWITTKLVDKQIDKLNIDNQTKVKIKDDYKKKNSKSWEAERKIDNNIRKIISTRHQQSMSKVKNSKTHINLAVMKSY